MAKIAIVYWSGTGNTQAMAEAILEGLKAGGADASLFTVGEFDKGSLSSYDKIAFGCPAMGDEELETEDFQPMWDAIKGKLSGKKVAIFGSYNWNTGEWIQDWGADVANIGAELVCDPCPCLDAPDAGSEEETACIELGKAIANA
mgnify:CR=1 FL=1